MKGHMRAGLDENNLARLTKRERWNNKERKRINKKREPSRKRERVNFLICNRQIQRGEAREECKERERKRERGSVGKKMPTNGNPPSTLNQQQQPI
jgi:hypothetical protein